MRRLPAVLAVAALVALTLVPAALVAAPGAQAETVHAGLTDSAVVVSGSGPFSGLEVTVSQTQHLVNQAIDVSWTGGTPSGYQGVYLRDYLQVMQCWGDDPAGPARDQCQYGVSNGNPVGGTYVGQRQLPHGIVDPLEERGADGRTKTGVNGVIDVGGAAYVQFRSVTGEVVDPFHNSYFNGYTTNEIQAGRTQQDGTGREIFEVQTGAEANGLGCGVGVQAPDGTTAPRSCWLVIVPRGSTEVDGTPQAGNQPLSSSPLSLSNWEHRIVVPLGFSLLGSSRCATGGRERRVAGSENLSEAAYSWLPALCASTGSAFSYSQLSENEARNVLLHRSPGAPGMVFVSRPIPPEDLLAGSAPVYAPVALSGVAVGFNIERKLRSTSQDQRQGSRVFELKLTPLLVAKLLTQSYQAGVGGPSENLPAGNPFSLRDDPEFLALNPDWADWAPRVEAGSLLVSVEHTDAAWTLWRWVTADPEARAFLDGHPDPSGILLNGAYAGMESPRDDFPRSDQGCTQGAPPQPELCANDRFPYTVDMHDAARGTRRADTMAKTVWDPTAQPPVFKSSGPQQAGERLVMTVTDTASAARYGLQTASLRNAAGEFVEPTETGLLAAAVVMEPTGVPGVRQAAPADPAPGAYPLPMISYAVVDPPAIEAAAGADHAAFIRYAVDAGQSPGQSPGELPAGYVPLPTPLRKQALAAAVAIAEEAGKAVEVPPARVGGGGSVPWEDAWSDTSSWFDGGSDLPGGGSGGSGRGPSAASAADLASPPPRSGAGDVVAAAVRTPADPGGWQRFAVPAALLLGLAAAVAGPSLQLAGRRRALRAGAAGGGVTGGATPPGEP